jgi:hypothetical protein
MAGGAVAPSNVTAEAESESEAAARRFFESYVALSDRFDPAVAELYSDSARIRTSRTSATGAVQELEMSGDRWKKLLVSALPVARERGDQNVFSEVDVADEPHGVRVMAERYSVLKCTRDEAYYMVVAADAGGALRIVEEYSETTVTSACGQGGGKTLDQRLREVAEQLGPRLPLQVDAETRLDAVSVDGQRLTYHFTLLVSDVDPAALRAVLEPQLIQQTCGDSTLSAIVNERGSVAYDYVDVQGKPVASVTVGTCAKP